MDEEVAKEMEQEEREKQERLEQEERERQERRSRLRSHKVRHDSWGKKSQIKGVLC